MSAPGAAAFVSTQASTKVYRSPRGTSAELHGARRRRTALLVVVPDPVVCFAGVALPAGRSASISPTAAAWCSSTGCRRAGTPSGERWAFDEYGARCRVRVDGTAACSTTRCALRADDGDLRGRLGRFDVLADVLLVGRARCATAARGVAARVAATPVGRRADQLMAATPVGDGGVPACASPARRSKRVGRTAARVPAVSCPALLGDDPWARKW